MLFSLGTSLITLAVVLVFFVIYHRLTANNRSLEKVKRLADKLQNGLDDYVGARSEELKHYGIDLDVQQKAAKIALEKLQAAQSAVTEKAEAIGAIADRFKEYDEVLAKLMEMTARVDENLARIHNDETFAEGVNRKLELAKKSLTAIERELPLLRESFAQEAQRTIETFRDDILNELQDGLASTATELNSVRDEAMAAFAQAQSARALVDEEFGKALEAARARASSVEDEAFASLTVSFASRLEELSSSSARQLAQLGQDTARDIGELRSAIEAFKGKWRDEAQDMLADIKAKLGEAEDIFARKATEIAGLLESSAKRAGEKEAEFSDTAARTENELTEIAGKAKLELGETAAKARQDMEATLAELATLEGSLKTSMDSTKTRIEEEFAAFGQAFEDHRSRFEADFKAETSALGLSLVRLGKDIETLKTEAYENAGEKLEGFEDQLLSDLSERKAQAFGQLDAWLSDMEKTLSGIVAEAGTRRNAAEAMRPIGKEEAPRDKTPGDGDAAEI